MKQIKQISPCGQVLRLNLPVQNCSPLFLTYMFIITGQCQRHSLLCVFPKKPDNSLMQTHTLTRSPQCLNCNCFHVGIWKVWHTVRACFSLSLALCCSWGKFARVCGMQAEDLRWAVPPGPQRWLAHSLLQVSFYVNRFHNSDGTWTPTHSVNKCNSELAVTELFTPCGTILGKKLSVQHRHCQHLALPLTVAAIQHLFFQLVSMDLWERKFSPQSPLVVASCSQLKRSWYLVTFSNS